MRPLWQELYLDGGDFYRAVARMIGHLGVPAKEFWAKAEKLPGFDRWRYEQAVLDLTKYVPRDQPDARLEFNAAARKCVRVFLGPPPDSDEHVAWWRARLISEPKDTPPVPLPPEAKRPEPTRKEPAKKGTRKPPAKKPKKAG